MTEPMKIASRPRIRTIRFLVRLTAEEDRAYREAAAMSGLSVSSWVRERLSKAAAKERA